VKLTPPLLGRSALRAVLAHIADARVDRIVCLGNVATLGPAPQRVLETLAELACPCILGNHDELLLDADLIRRYTEIRSSSRRWTLVEPRWARRS
jgi:hypothetical protein